MNQLNLFDDNAKLATADDSLFGEVIYAYTRRQAIEDGVLVQLSGEGYEGDAWVPAMVKEAGFRFPVAMTAEAFALCVELSPAAKRACNDLKGRLWDVLWMLKNAIRRANSTDTERRLCSTIATTMAGFNSHTSLWTKRERWLPGSISGTLA